jgi:ornithine carbamoyltransferase
VTAARPKDLVSMADLPAGLVARLIRDARALKARRRPTRLLEGKTLVMIFQKPSTRTAVSFAVAMHELGGMGLSLHDTDLQLHRGETLADTARVLSRYASGIMIRARRHEDVLELARHAAVPVISGLTDREHPCQVLADLMTLVEVFRLSGPAGLKDRPVAYVGDGNNMAHSWIWAAATLGFPLALACPRGYEPDPRLVRAARDRARETGGAIRLERDPRSAVRGAWAVYTDVWTSMGKERESARRRRVFHPYQVNAELVRAADPRAVVLHCLPAHRGEEITSDVLESPRAVVFQQAENRLHIQKAILAEWLGTGKKTRENR